MVFFISPDHNKTSFPGQSLLGWLWLISHKVSEILGCHMSLTMIDHSSHKTCPQWYPLSCSKLSLVAELTLVGSLPTAFA